MLLARADFRQKRKKIKAFAFRIITQVMVSQVRATGRVENHVRIQVDGQPWVWDHVDPLLTPERQTDMLQRILEEDGDRDIAHPDSNLQALGDVVRGMVIKENDTQLTRRKVRKNLNPRQFLDWDTHVDLVFVSKFDITQQVIRNNTGLEGKKLEKAVASMWDGGSCFPLGLHWVGSEKLTKAEILIWCPRHGYGRHQATEQFNEYWAVQPEEQREVPTQWRQLTIDREIMWNASAQ